MLTSHAGKFWWKFSFKNNSLAGPVLLIFLLKINDTVPARGLFWKLNVQD